MLVLKDLGVFIEPFRFSFFSVAGWGIVLDYCDIEWFALETNRDHSVVLGCGVSLYGCSSKAQPLLLTLDEGYLFTAAPPDLERGVAPLSPPSPAQPYLFGLT